MLNSVRTEWAFDHCKECEEFDADVQTRNITSGGRMCLREVTVRCSHAQLCRRLKGVLKRTAGGEIHQTVD